MAKHYTVGELMAIDSVRQDKAGKSTVKFERVFHEVRKITLLDRFKAFFGGKSTIQNYKVIFKFTVTSDTGNKHIVFIRLDPDFDMTNVNGNRVDVYCDCADFKYRSAYLLNKRDSLFKNSSTTAALGSAINEAPKKATTTILCKHSYAALSWLVKNYSNIMKTI